MEANDPVAMTQWGKKQYVKGNYSSAFEYFTRAAELGDVLAHYQLALMHHYGDGVEKDKGKEMYHLEEAAIGGHPYARYNIGCEEWKNGNDERAAKHWIIAASQGDDSSMKALIAAYKGGLINKEDLAAALRAHQAAVDATKSPQREAAEEYRQMMSSAD
ncbi:Sel1-like repeat family protein [Skeletonema marinoi]|uniref:Sel1-like repeat family protein n=1 Tax=Skeletonema marinoi TaxID=267567 RepID=A0AAD9D5H2_9STRA|nr:Sel1-like repeat family protein [Skeletonema marinoi]